MPIISFGGKSPRIAESALIADTSYIIGDVEIGENTSVWPGAVVRGDMMSIRVGNNCHIEENTVLHGRVVIGDNAMVGHNCVVEGNVGENTLVGNHATILAFADIGNFCIIAANSTVMERAKIPDRSFVVGSPASIKGELTQKNIKKMDFYMPPYVDLVKEYKKQGIWERTK
ncbi:gamma carbonic anhydrase family protein [Chloroflexota bacterium]